MKHLRPNELDDEQRALINAARDLDDEEAAIRAEGSFGCFAPGELIEVNGQLVCWECGRVGSIWSGYCRIHGEEE